jgi:hypothetical protein
MNQSKKRTYILLAVLILLMTGGLFLYKHLNNADIVNGNPASDSKNSQEKLQPVSTVEKDKISADSNTIKFKTNDDIKVRYGKIEEVYLYNGKKYEGAVLTTDEFYTIVTVNGTFKIPMNEVKLRNIIR